MSEAEAHRFLEEVRRNEVLRQQLEALRGRDALVALAAIAAEAGFDFTEEEYRAAVVAQAEGELSEDAIREVQREMGL